MPRMKHDAPMAPPSAPLLTTDGPEPDDDIPDTFPVPPGLAEELMAQATPGLQGTTGPEPVEVRITSDASPPPVAAQVPREATRMAQEPSRAATPPSVPPTVPVLPDAFLPLAHGFCQYLQGVFGAKLEDAALQMTKAMGVTMDGMARYTQGVLQCNEHAEVQLSDAIARLFEQGMEVRSAPYEMTLQVYTPSGIPLTLTIRKSSAAELLDELTRLETWCAVNGYGGEKPREVAA